jgi:hypothetical protein
VSSRFSSSLSGSWVAAGNDDSRQNIVLLLCRLLFCCAHLSVCLHPLAEHRSAPGATGLPVFFPPAACRLDYQANCVCQVVCRRIVQADAERGTRRGEWHPATGLARIAHGRWYSTTARLTPARSASEGNSFAVPRLRFGLVLGRALSGVAASQSRRPGPVLAYSRRIARRPPLAAFHRRGTGMIGFGSGSGTTRSRIWTP